MAAQDTGPRRPVPRVGRALACGHARASVVLSTAAFFARPLAATFALAAECGYTGVEVMVTKDPASQDPREMRRARRRTTA